MRKPKKKKVKTLVLNKSVCICKCFYVSLYLYIEMHVCMMDKCADSYYVSGGCALTVLRSCAQSLGRCLRCRLCSGGYRASIR